MDRHRGRGRGSLDNFVDVFRRSWLLLPLWLILSGCSAEVVELPPPEPPRTAVCCGCLCLDDSWSCTASTCLAADGGVVELGPEMGLLEIDAEPYASSESGLHPRRGIRARVSYTFLPADEGAEDKPLIVLFNGGPGSSTAILFGLNTGPHTLDPERAGENPHSWTRFANLLYVDMPGTGYGYLLAEPDGHTIPPEQRFDPWHDAAQFITVVLRFLERHPQLRAGPVVLAGESYGGTRASMMLHLLLHHEQLLDGSPYRNARLYDEIRAHFAAVSGAEGEVTPDDVAQQFIGQLLIQPYAGPLGGGPLPDACEIDGDAYQCDEPVGFLDEQVLQVLQGLVRPDIVQQMTGVDLTTIEWLAPEHRGAIYGREDGYGSLDESALNEALGEPVGGAYYAPGIGWAYIPWLGADGAALVMLSSAYHTETFITDAPLDLVVPTGLFPGYLASLGDWVSQLDYRQDSPAGSSRPGEMLVTLEGAFFEAPRSRTIRFPHYPQAGHVVTLRAPAEIAEDVQLWLAGITATGAPPP